MPGDMQPFDRLPVVGSNAHLDASNPRDWALPGADEVFRGIYTRAGAGGSEVLAVCSAVSGEGRTTVALGLASTIAQDFPERRVLLVETDLNHPALAEDFDVAGSPGLIECLLEGQSVQVAYRATFLENLDFLPAGGPTRDPRRLLASSRMAAAADIMRQTHDVIVIDTPPVLTSSDALVVSDLADGVLFVVRAGATPLPLVQKAIDQLDEDKVRGVVLNAGQSSVPSWFRRVCGL
jgi:capsular exopolysaccharide synthesis family protein